MACWAPGKADHAKDSLRIQTLQRRALDCLGLFRFGLAVVTQNFQQQFGKIGNVFNQYPYRFEQILKILTDKNVTQLDAVVGRGGMLPPNTSGTYQINQKMFVNIKNNCFTVSQFSLTAFV